MLILSSSFKTLLLLLFCNSLYANQQLITELKQIQCSQIFTKESYISCYDYKYKSSLYVIYTVKKSILQLPSITKRPNFYSESSLPSTLVITNTQFTKSGFDKGHLANDSTFDYDQNTLNETYNLINIIAQYPRANRRTWRLIENYEKTQALLYDEVVVYNYIKYSNIQINGIYIPNEMYKILHYNNKYECFLVYNNNDKNYHSFPLDYYKIKCEGIKI